MHFRHIALSLSPYENCLISQDGSINGDSYPRVLLIRIIKAETSRQLPWLNWWQAIPHRIWQACTGLASEAWLSAICIHLQITSNPAISFYFTWNRWQLMQNQVKLLPISTATWGKLNLYTQGMGQCFSQIMNLTTRWDSPDTQPQEIFRLLMSNSVHP